MGVNPRALRGSALPRAKAAFARPHDRPFGGGEGREGKETHGLRDPRRRPSPLRIVNHSLRSFSACPPLPEVVPIVPDAALFRQRNV
jgi:hypothetical protein